MNPLRIAVLGAPATGKTRLATELASALPPPAPSTHWANRVVVTDDPPAGDGHVFSDKHALAAFDLILLMGLDLGASASQVDADAAIRRMLAVGTLDYRVIYGHGGERLNNALAAIPSSWAQALQTAHPQAANTTPDTSRAAQKQTRARWTWSCDKCSDPAGEHTLFTRLQSDRRQRAA